MKKATLIFAGICAAFTAFSQNEPPAIVIKCDDFHVTKPLTEIFANNEAQLEKVYNKIESEDREHRTPQKFPFANKDPKIYGNDPATMQREMGTVPGKAPLTNWAGQTASGFYPLDPSGAAGPSHYVQMINATTFKVFNKSTGASMLTGTLGALWSPALAYNDGDPIVLYDKAADRWFLAQFGDDDGLAGNKIHIAISTTSNPTGSYYTYTFTSPQFPDYLKFSVWQDGYYMTSNQTQRVFVFERTQMLAGNPSARAISQTFSPPDAGYFFVPLPGDAGDGTLPAAGTPCPIFSYSDNGWGAGYSDAINIYKVTVSWAATATESITSAGSVPTAAFDGSYDAGWLDCPQPGTSQKIDGIGGVLMYRAQWKTWSGYNSVVLNWGVKISSTQRSIKWCELHQNQSTGVWSMYQEGIYTPDANTRWLGSIAMDNNGSIGLCYMKSNSSSIYPGLYYTGRRTCDPLGTLPVTETVATAGLGSQSGVNRDGDYSETWLDPDGVTFWHTGMYMGSGGSEQTRVFSFQITPCAGAAPVANFSGTPTTVCAGSSVAFTDLSTNTPTSWSWTFTGGTPASSTVQNPTVVYNTPGTYAVSLAASNGSGSNTHTVAGYITVVALPATPTASSSSPDCVGQTISLTTPTVSGATYSWTGPSAYTSTTQNPTRPSATTAMAGTYSVTVTVGGCTSLPGTTAVVINTVPGAPTATATTPVCTGNTINFTASTVAGATYAWTGPSSFTASTQNPTRPAATTIMAGTYSVTVTVNGCTSTFGTTSPVVVNTTPAAPTATNAGPYCAGSTINLTSSTLAGATYSWTGPASFTSTTQNPTRPASTTAMAGTYSVTVTSSSGCTSAAGTTTVVVNASPAATVPTSTSYCAGSTVPASAFTSTPAGATYTWTNSNAAIGLAASGSGNAPSFTATNTGSTNITGTITVTPTLSGCTGAASTYTITVKPTPTVTVPANITICSGSSVPASAFTSPVTGATFAWTNSNTAIGLAASGSGNVPSFTATNAGATAITGTITVTPTANGCTGTPNTYSITVNPKPASTFTSSANQCLTGNSFTFTNTGGSGTYSWTFAGGSPSTSTTNNPSGVTFSTAGTHTITHTVTSAAGCVSTATSSTITIFASPTALSTTTTSASCATSNGSITIGATTGGTAPYTYSVNGSGFTSATSYTSMAAGTYTVIVKDANGCQFTTTATIGSSSGPTALASTSTNSTCDGTDGSVTIGTPTGGTGPYTYSFNGGAYGSTTVFSGLSAGTYSIAVKDANGCVFSTTVVVGNTGSTPATPSISAVGSVLTSSSATGNQWYFNGTLIAGATNQTYTVTANGIYTVVVTTGGCSSAVSSPYNFNSVGIIESGNDPYSLMVYPNPNDGNFTISFSSVEKSTYNVEINNALGQLIYKEEVKDFVGTYTKQMSVVEYGQGVYTISLIDSKNQTVKKIIVY